MIFPYISLYTQAVAYTTYVESAAEGLSKIHQKDDLWAWEACAFLSVNTSRRLHLCATPAVISCYACRTNIENYRKSRVFIAINEIENFHVAQNWLGRKPYARLMSTGHASVYENYLRQLIMVCEKLWTTLNLESAWYKVQTPVLTWKTAICQLVDILLQCLPIGLRWKTSLSLSWFLQ